MRILVVEDDKRIASFVVNGLKQNGFAVDHVICPEESVMRYLHQLISYPEALQVLEFADGRASLIAIRATQGGSLVGHTIGLVASADGSLAARRNCYLSW